MILSFIKSQYASEAEILIGDAETVYTQPAAGSRQPAPIVTPADQEAVASQVRVLRSQDLASVVIRELKLDKQAEFNPALASLDPFKRVLILLGLERDLSKMTTEERVQYLYEKSLQVTHVADSRVIGVRFYSQDPKLAAALANHLAEAYVQEQRLQRIERTAGASEWLTRQISELRKKVEDSESKVERYKAEKGLFSGQNNVALSVQKLQELNSQLILASAQRSEAEARARLIKKMLRDKGDVGAASDVLKSQLIQRLLEQRAQVQRNLSELSATLLPSHPRIRQLNAELAGLSRQIRRETAKIVEGLENEAQIAGVREASLRKSLDELKARAGETSESSVELRALERDAKSNRDLLEAYLARLRDASARRDAAAVPAKATIISRARASTIPAFPKKGPILLIAVAAAAVLAIGAVFTRELLVGPSRDAAPIDHADPVPVQAKQRAEQRPAERVADRVPERAEEPAPAPQMAEPAPAPKKTVEVPAPEKKVEAPAPKKTVEAPALRLKVQTPPRDTKQPAAAAKPKTDKPAPEGERTPASDATKTDAKGLGRLFGWLKRKKPDAEAKLKAKLKAKPEAKPAAPAAKPAPSARRRPSARPEPSVQPKPSAKAKPEAKTAGVKRPASERNQKGKRVELVGRAEDIAVRLHGAARDDRSMTAVLVALDPRAQVTGSLLAVARALSESELGTLLIDVSERTSSVAGQLGLPRTPGFRELVLGKASFSDVIRRDPDSPLQVVTSGNPRLVTARTPDIALFDRIRKALQETYDSVLITTDPRGADGMMDVLDGDVDAIVVIGAEQGDGAAITEMLRTLSGAAPKAELLGCWASEPKRKGKSFAFWQRGGGEAAPV